MLIVGTRQVIEALRPRQEESSGPRDVHDLNPYYPLPDHTGYLERQNLLSKWPHACFSSHFPEGWVAEAEGCGKSWNMWTQVSSCMFLVYLTLKVEAGLRGKGTRLQDQAAGLISQPCHILGQNSKFKNPKCKLSLPRH